MSSEMATIFDTVALYSDGPCRNLSTFQLYFCQVLIGIELLGG